MASCDITADDVYNRVLYSNWEPVGWEIEQDYGLSSPSVSKVKRIVKARFAEEGMVWGYDPALNRFVLAPSNTEGAQRRIIEYEIEHASSAANSIRYQVRGAETSGAITPASAKDANDAIADGANRIHSAIRKLDWGTSNPALTVVPDLEVA